jgi:hypothetical protein
MLELIHNGWKVTRQVGIGDRENVRAGLMQVAAFSHAHLEVQVNAALDAALREQRTLRIYTNGTLLKQTNADLEFKLSRVTMKRARDHDLMLMGNLPTDFRYSIERVDMLIEPLQENVSGEDLLFVLRKMWQEHGRSKLHLPGIARKSYDEARQLFPELAIDLNRAWTQFSEGK